MRKILIVEDDYHIQSSLKEILELNHFQVIQSYLYQDALKLLKKDIDLVILDIQLPDGNGIDLCRMIRQTYQMPILFLTCRQDEETIVEGLNAGGDDYVVKPFGIKELNARIASLLRRISPLHEWISTADLMINTHEFQVYKNGELLDLGLVTYHILLCLINGHGTVITREHLLDLVEHQTHHFVENNTLSVHMKRLRSKLGDYQGQPYIETLRGVGYRWIQ